MIVLGGASTGRVVADAAALHGEQPRLKTPPPFTACPPTIERSLIAAVALPMVNTLPELSKPPLILVALIPGPSIVSGLTVGPIVTWSVKLPGPT